MQYVGIDIHATALRATFLDDDGRTESKRFDNTAQGRQALQQLLAAQKSVVALAAAPQAAELQHFLTPHVERVLLVDATDLFQMFPGELGKKTLNLAKVAHRAAHEASVEQLLGQSVAEIEKLLAGGRQSIEAALKGHAPEPWPEDLWARESQAWLEEQVGRLPAAEQEATRKQLKLCEEMGAELSEMKRLMRV